MLLNREAFHCLIVGGLSVNNRETEVNLLRGHEALLLSGEDRLSLLIAREQSISYGFCGLRARTKALTNCPSTVCCSSAESVATDALAPLDAISSSE